MANQESVTKALTERPQVRTVGLIEMIKEATRELSLALPKHMSAERIVRIAQTCIRTTPKLMQCTPESFMGALFTSAQMGIEPIAKRAFLLPFNNSYNVNGQWVKRMEVQFILGYPGVVDLFFRHARSVELGWGTVYENEYNDPARFDYQKGTDGFLNHKPLLKNRGQAVAYYAHAKLTGGGRPVELMGADECLEHGRAHSKTYDKKTTEFYKDSPWKTDPDAMSLKTVLLQLSKLLPLSVDLQLALQTDETTREYRKGVKDMLEVPSTTNWSPEPPVAIEAKPPQTVKAPEIGAPGKPKSDMWDGDEPAE